MAGPFKDVEAHMANASDRFRALHERLDGIVRRVLPDAEAVRAYGMLGWRVRLKHPPPEATWRGTFDREHFFVGAVERKAGLTVHLWNPSRPDFLKDHATRLRAAGFKPMVGCVQFNRKTDLPWDEVERLLVAAKRDL